MSVGRVFLISVVVFITFAAGYFDTIDANPSLETARALVEHGTLAVQLKERNVWLYHPERGGLRRSYTKMGLAYPILYVPAAAIGDLFSPASRERVSEFVASMVNPIVTAGIIALLYLFYLEQGVEPRRALGLSAIVGLATILFPYSKSAHREPLQALCLTGVLVMATRRQWLAAGGFAAVGFLTKLALAVPLVPALIYAAYLPREGERVRWRALLLPVLAALVGWAIFANHAWKSPFATGYGESVNHMAGKPWRTPFLAGVYELWLSPETGLLFYSPTILLSLFCFRRNALGFAVFGCVLLQTALYAKWAASSGALGPRFLVTIVPCLALLWKDIEWKRWMIPLVALSFFLQIASTSVKMQQYWAMRARSCSALTDPQWFANLKILDHKLSGKPEVYRPETFGGEACGKIDLTGAQSLAGLNYWWLHATRR